MSVVFENHFSAHCLAFSFALCLGLSFAFLTKIFIFRCKRAVASRSFAFFCVFMSFALVLYTSLVFITKNLFCISEFIKDYSCYFLLLSIFFFIGFFIAFFWKIAVPAFLVLYLSFTVFTDYVLDSLFETGDVVHSVLADEKTFKIRDKVVSRSSELHHAVTVSLYRLPDILVLPVRRNWIAFEGVAESELPFEKKQDVSDSFAEKVTSISEYKRPEILENRIVLFYLNHFILSGQSSRLILPFPDEKNYPSLYSAHVSVKNNEVSCELVRDL